MSESSHLIFSEDLPGGGLWSWPLRRHTTLRLTALGDGANIGLMAFNQSNPLDRMNLPDTLKAQHTAKLTRGHILMSDMGHALLSITADTLGWHDSLGGHSNAAQILQKYGPAPYQTHRNAWHRNAHDNFLVELAKHGLDRRALVANVNFFSRVDVDHDGSMHFLTPHSKAGDSVDLRAEMDVLVVLNSCPHPLDPAPAYAPPAVHLTLFHTSPPGPDDYCRKHRPENTRCLALTERLHGHVHPLESH